VDSPEIVGRETTLARLDPAAGIISR